MHTETNTHTCCTARGARRDRRGSLADGLTRWDGRGSEHAMVMGEYGFIYCTPLWTE